MSEGFNELDPVALVKDLPQQGLVAGHTGAIVYVHEGGKAFEVEFLLDGRRSMVCTVTPEYLLKLKGMATTSRAD